MNFLIDYCDIFFVDIGLLESQSDWLKELYYTILLRQGDLGESMSVCVCVCV